MEQCHLDERDQAPCTHNLYSWQHRPDFKGKSLFNENLRPSKINCQQNVTKVLTLCPRCYHAEIPVWTTRWCSESVVRSRNIHRHCSSLVVWTKFVIMVCSAHCPASFWLLLKLWKVQHKPETGSVYLQNKICPFWNMLAAKQSFYFESGSSPFLCTAPFQV